MKNILRSLGKILKKLPKYLLIYIIIVTLIIEIQMIKKANDYRKNKNPGKLPKYDDKLALVDDMNDGINLRLELIDEAEDSLDICYYIIDNSNTSTVFLDHLIKAADRGVKVRFITNKFNSNFRAKNSWREKILVNHPNIDFYYYKNPWYNFYSLQDMNHDKVIIADGTYLLTGGRNIGDRFFIKNDKMVDDLDICVIRKSKTSSIDNFMAYYEDLINLKHVKKVKSKNIDYEKLRIKLRASLEETDKSFIKEENVLEKLAFRDVKMNFVHNTLGEVVKNPEIAYHLGLLGENSKSIKWVSPYIVPTRPIRQLLNLQNDKKIDFVTNSAVSTPNYPGFGATLAYKSRTDKFGDFYSYKGEGSIHTKAVLFDDGISAIGTFNLDPRSAFLATETMAIVDSDEFQNDLSAYVENLDKTRWDEAAKDKPPRIL